MGENGQQAVADVVERWKLNRGETNKTIAAALAGEGISTTESTVSLWLRCRQELRPEEVFALERVLNVEPGELSAHLGYLPVGTLPSVVHAIDADTDVTDDMKQVLRTIYRDHVGRRRRRNHR